jgi:hypothetical protein
MPPFFAGDMFMKAITIAVAAALLATSGAAVAQSTTDAGCILVANAFAQGTKDAQAQKLAEASFYFYLGRISDHETSAQLKTLLDAKAKTLTDATASTVMNACVKQLQDKLDMIKSIAGQSAPPAAAPTKKP